MIPEKLAYFIMLGQTAENSVSSHPETAAQETLPLSKSLDLALSIPSTVNSANKAAEVYRYLFVFENFLRDFIKDILSEGDQNWWQVKIPPDVKTEVAKSKETEETKAWMALGSREEIALTTYPQLFTIIDHRWKEDFGEIIKDKHLLQEARHIAHMRNAICHMTDIPDEEVNRVKQVMRDWFRVVSP